MQEKRRRALTGMSAVAAARLVAPIGALTASAGDSAFGATSQAQPATAAGRDPAMATITVQTERPLRAVNPLILGNNIDWTHSAQGLNEEKSSRIKPRYLELADRLAPTALRYPGGTNSDFYRWRNGLGPYAKRPPTRTLEGKEEVIGLGTDEYLDLCKRWRSEPLITVNIATGTAEEAAEWVRYTNRRGTDLPRVKYWEVGNEPYLKSHFPEAGMQPEEYARRVNAFIRAMKAVDPSIQTGVTLRNDTLGGVESTPFRGFNDIVLKGVTEPFEFAALHSSYFPVTFEKKESPEEMFLATMAGSRIMQEDMANTRDAIRKYHPGRNVRLAFTEYNVLYSLDILRWGLASIFLSKTDRYIESMAGALYAADLLRVFSLTDDLLMANFWALCGNWWFGAISHEGTPRPQFHVLEAYRDLASGQLLESEVNSPVMATARSGFVPAQKDIPVVAAHAVADKGVVRIAAINRHPRQAVQVRVSLPGTQGGQLEIRDLTADQFFSRSVAWSTRNVTIRDGVADLAIPRHAFSVMTLRPS